MPYCCTLCNKSFTFQQSYHKHMLYHSSEKPYACNECGRAFKELSTLQNHARIHSGERPFGCETCGKRFRQRVSYLVHRRIHTGVMPYKCTACDKSFRYKVSQRSHKCPMNPPGSVIRIPDADKSGLQEQNTSSSPTQPIAPSTAQNNTKCIMSVDLNTGNINFIPEAQETKANPSIFYVANSSGFQEDAQVQKKSIMINCSEQIEISYNKADLQSAIGETQLQEDVKSQRVISSRENEEDPVGICTQGNLDSLQKLAYTDTDNDLFSMVLSPILPEVESLCLNNSSDNNSPTGTHQEETISLMEEKCLEEFLYGPN